ncbi:MAG TPA: hypothetical protein DEF51_56660 [Myxococcales bacterium]|nr:hypothetical protein [Myxococcales bacterium]
MPLLVEGDLYVYAYAHDDPGELAVVAVNRGGAITDRGVDGLTGSLLGAVTSLERLAGGGSARLDGGRLRVSLGAGESAVFVGR